MARTIAKDYDDKRRHILKVAAQVFAREGIARASMNEVARACGISKANIYHYYSGKDELIFDILDSYLSELRDLILSVDRNGLSPQDQLAVITREFLLAYEGMDDEHKIQTEGLPLLEPAKQKVLKGYQRDLVELVAGILRECSPKTLAFDQTQCRDVTMSVFGMINWFYMWHPRASKDDRIAYAATVVNLTLNGISDPQD